MCQLVQESMGLMRLKPPENTEIKVVKTLKMKPDGILKIQDKKKTIQLIHKIEVKRGKAAEQDPIDLIMQPVVSSPKREAQEVPRQVTDFLAKVR